MRQGKTMFSLCYAIELKNNIFYMCSSYLFSVWTQESADWSKPLTRRWPPIWVNDYTSRQRAVPKMHAYKSKALNLPTAACTGVEWTFSMRPLVTYELICRSWVSGIFFRSQLAYRMFLMFYFLRALSLWIFNIFFFSLWLLHKTLFNSWRKKKTF